MQLVFIRQVTRCLNGRSERLGCVIVKPSTPGFGGAGTDVAWP